MSAEAFVNAALLSAPGVTALVGAGAAARIYPDEAVEGADLPLIVYERGNTTLEHTLLADRVVASTTPITVTCWAKKRIDAEALVDAVIAAMFVAQVPPLTRDGEYDDVNQAYGGVVAFEIWEF
jgi:hypothetical protein